MALGRRSRGTDGSISVDALVAAGSDPLLGTLRSELDDDVSLPPLFAEVHERAAAIREAVVTGQQKREDAARELSGLRICAPDGTLWTAGATSLNWFRKLPGGSWTRHVPPLGDGANAYHLLDPVETGADDNLPADAGPDADGSTSERDADAAPGTDGAVAADSPDAAPAVGDSAGGGASDDERGLLSLDDLASLARDLDDDPSGLPAGLSELPALQDDPDRVASGSQAPLELPRLVEPGASAADTDDALGDGGTLDDEALSWLSGQGTADGDGEDEDEGEDGYGASKPGTVADWEIGQNDDEDDEFDFGYGS